MRVAHTRVLACVVGLLPLSTLVRAQAILHPNQLVGHVSLPTTNPVIAARLSADAPGSWTLEASSADGSNLHHRSLAGSSSLDTEVAYEVTVETSFAGISYDLNVEGYAANGSMDWYDFERATSAPVFPEPSPDVELDVSECPGAVRFHWVDVTGAPVAVTGGQAYAWRNMARATGSASTYMAQARSIIPASATEIVFVVHGDGQPFHLQVDYTLGRDPFSDLVRYRYEQDVAVHCDEVVDIVHVAGDDPGGLSACAPLQLGALTGRFDIVGEHEHYLAGTPPSSAFSTTLIRALEGPWGNSRYGLLPGDPSTGTFELPNLMPSGVEVPPKPYQVSALASIRSGDRFEIAATPWLPEDIGCGETVDLGDALVMHPGYISGDVVLAGPPPLPPPAGSPFEHLARSTDPAHDSDQDGIPDRQGQALEAASNAWAVPVVARAWSTSTSFPGAMDADGATFRGDRELVLPDPHDQPIDWDTGLQLVTEDKADPSDPVRYLDVPYERLFDPASTHVTVAPGDHLRQDEWFCFSRVTVWFLDVGGTFYDPEICPYGHLGGPDSRGVTRDYRCDARSYGTPVDEANASAVGLVNTVLPEGLYVISPYVTSVNPGGGTTQTQLVPFPLTVGCRQDIVVYADLRGVMEAIGPCADEGLVHVQGHVEGTADVARIEWSVNGGGPTVACTSCGVAPDYAFNAPVGLQPNAILVRIVASDGREVTATGYTQPAREPSAVDRRPGIQPLRVGRGVAGSLELTWEDVPGAKADVFRGTLAAFHSPTHYDHAAFGACAQSSGGAIVADTAGSYYYVVAGACGWGDGSLGRDSLGRERPRPMSACP